MSSIASGPGLGSGYNVDLSVQQVGATESRLSLNTDANAAATANSASVNLAANTQVSASTAAATSATSAQAVVTSTQASAGAAPVDTDRVATIKKAIEDGNYPLVPTKIGDAMIAAGMLLRINK
ncbi:flagellar biosynthesis anti-sigma factor FlgM [Novosphingobium terrae]|jgi:negative regulator of flagellin synthesis FlgM|uniref:flagellar biosynthesis anti-sigma factor FlgM n=1 Tax=Novosphingobium terrae TaxID=2726189 RepID=UPI00197FF311|nr:flagellar biosynthesis anti-sigma factor FlgM [Novosphingobium terrae]